MMNMDLECNEIREEVLYVEGVEKLVSKWIFRANVLIRSCKSNKRYFPICEVLCCHM
jgi:hypothetical protein